LLLLKSGEKLGSTHKLGILTSTTNAKVVAWFIVNDKIKNGK